MAKRNRRFCYNRLYNFVTVHSRLKTTPAVAYGLTGHVWTMEERLAELAVHRNQT
jgi:hypothetical protein